MCTQKQKNHIFRVESGMHACLQKTGDIIGYNDHDEADTVSGKIKLNFPTLTEKLCCPMLPERTAETSGRAVRVTQ